MLNIVLAVLRSGREVSSFEEYYGALVAKAPQVAPTAGEARREYSRRVLELVNLYTL